MGDIFIESQIGERGREFRTLLKGDLKLRKAASLGWTIYKLEQAAGRLSETAVWDRFRRSF